MRRIWNQAGFLFHFLWSRKRCAKQVTELIFPWPPQNTSFPFFWIKIILHLFITIIQVYNKHGCVWRWRKYDFLKDCFYRYRQKMWKRTSCFYGGVKVERRVWESVSKVGMCVILFIFAWVASGRVSRALGVIFALVGGSFLLRPCHFLLCAHTIFQCYHVTTSRWFSQNSVVFAEVQSILPIERKCMEKRREKTEISIKNTQQNALVCKRKRFFPNFLKMKIYFLFSWANSSTNVMSN